MSLKHLGLGALLCTAMGLNAVAQDVEKAPATDAKAKMAELRNKAKSVGGQLGRKKRTLMKDNAEAKAIAKELKELDAKRQELDQKLNDTLVAADPEYKKLAEEMTAIQAELATIKESMKPPKKRPAKEKKPAAE